ncbi:class I SAM-dependent methyltransferase [Pasteurellaceae bacterium LIM206]|nr:class I SAM-dependent methyltransferase [Pasteurellaceae bacterium LIM206]
METIYDIDFAQLYKKHVQQATREPKLPRDWDQKAEKMQVTGFDLHNHYVQDFLSRMDFSPTDTVLDIGCGGGAIGLALADKVKHVYLLDYSEKMLALCRQRAENLGVTNITTILCSWDDNWDQVPEADICVASRSTMVNDLADALDKVNSKARKAAYLTMTVEKDFVSRDVLRFIKRDGVGFPTYIYAVNILYQQGYYADVNLMDTHACMTPPQENFTVEDFIKSVRWSIGALTDQEVDGLRQYFSLHKETLGVHTSHRRWAFISWKK